jgi:prepilin-type N-terminal cleavage/methylation domain-containing protein
MKFKKTYFTLIELIVVMGVFAILLLVASTIFTLAQKAWTQSSGTIMIFENAQIAMELMTRDLQSVYYKKNKVPFWYKCADENNNQFSNESLNFVSKQKEPPIGATNKYCEIKYQLYNSDDLLNAESGWIRRSVTGNNSSTKWNFWKNLTAGLTGSSNAFTADNDSSVEYQNLIPHVTDLAFTCYDKDGNTLSGTLDTVVELPFSIEINLSLMDRYAWQKWVAIDSNRSIESPDAIAFRKKHERTFTKTVYIGDRGQYDS